VLNATLLRSVSALAGDEATLAKNANASAVTIGARMPVTP
jgi:hypothetical protein